jgi:uncharacterized protein YcbK (DUF882 family)
MGRGQDKSNCKSHESDLQNPEQAIKRTEMKLTKNFFISEFSCNDSTPVPDRLAANVLELSQNLQVLRDEIGEPLTILSGYRTPSWNKRVGGKPNSYHMKAMAADLTTKSFTPKQLHAKIEKLIKAGKMKQGGLGLYPGFVHYDIRGTLARW